MENDVILYAEATYEPTPINHQPRKKKCISHNDVSGQGSPN